MKETVTLGAACLLFSLQFLFSKGYQLRSGSSLRMSLRMTLYDGIWVFLLFFALNGFHIKITAGAALYGLLYAGCAIVCGVCSQFAMKLGKVAIVSLFTLTGGLVLPVFYGVAALGENLPPLKLVAVVLILLSLFPGVLLKRPSTAAQAPDAPRQEPAHGKKASLRFLLLCAVIFFTNGMVSVVTKAHSISPQSVPERDFLLFVALVRITAAGCALIVLRMAAARRAPAADGTACASPDIGGGWRRALLPFAIVGGYTACNAMGNVFSMLTAKSMPSSLQFPILSAVVIVLTALISWIAYREKPSFGDWVGMAMTVAGILMMIFI